MRNLSYLQDLFGDKNKNYLDNAFDIDKLSYGNWSLSPEFKFYPGKSGAFKGFYIASFFKYENVNIQYDYYLNWDYNGLNFNTDLPLDGNLNSFTGGIYIGIQWKLSTNWYLDWQIIGGNYGSGKLEISAKQNLTQEQQKEIREFAQDLQEEMNQIKYDVNDIITDKSEELSEYIVDSLKGIIDNKNGLVNIANKYLGSWPMNRLGLTDQAIILLGIYELINTKIEGPIVINEAINLSKKYSDDQVSKIINGVLDNVYHNEGKNGE